MRSLEVCEVVWVGLTASVQDTVALSRCAEQSLFVESSFSKSPVIRLNSMSIKDDNQRSLVEIARDPVNVQGISPPVDHEEAQTATRRTVVNVMRDQEERTVATIPATTCEQ